MTLATRQKIQDKLENLNEYVNYLEELKGEVKADFDKFMNDFHLFGSAERYFQLSIQVIIDVVQLLIVEEGLPKPDDNQEAISLVYNKGIISDKLAEKLDGVVGFRNILVHEYGKIDKEEVYRNLQNNIDDLTDFKREISKFLK